MRGVPGASDATRARVMRIADELGYVPDERARKLRQSRSRVLGVAFELQQPFHGDLVERLYAAAAARGYDIALSRGRAHPRRADRRRRRSLRERCEAVVLLGSRFTDDALDALAARRATLLVARRTAASGVGVVRGDDLVGIGLAVDHLVDARAPARSRTSTGRTRPAAPTAAWGSARPWPATGWAGTPTSSPVASPRPRAPAP